MTLRNDQANPAPRVTGFQIEHRPVTRGPVERLVMRIRIKPTEKDCEKYLHESYAELLFDDPQIYNWARLVFGIDEEGEDIECIDIFDDRIVARLKYAPPEDDDA